MAHVLVVENDAGNRFTLHQLIAMQGHAVVSVAGGADALHLLPARPPGIVLLDYRMPDIDGHDVMHFIAADVRLRRCQQVILVTASPHDLSPATHALLTLLAAPVLAKPFIVDVLPAALAAAVRRLQGGDCPPTLTESNA